MLLNLVLILAALALLPVAIPGALFLLALVLRALPVLMVMASAGYAAIYGKADPEPWQLGVMIAGTVIGGGWIIVRERAERR